LKNFKKRTNRKLLAEKRRKREARELALKKKLLKARDHRIPTVLSEPGEVRLRKLATKGGTSTHPSTQQATAVSSLIFSSSACSGATLQRGAEAAKGDGHERHGRT
jgi:hypothetical protein